MSLKKAFLSVVAVVTLSVSARADAIDFTTVSGLFRDGVPRVIGWEFTTGAQALSVTDLGVLYLPG